MSEVGSKPEGSTEVAKADASVAAGSQPIESSATAKKPVSKKAVPAKRAVAKKATRAKTARKPATSGKAKPAARAAKTIQTATKTSSNLKETIMPKTAKISKGIQDAVTGAQAKAKGAVEKGTALFGEAGEFTKGNVESVVESGKVLATGLQSMGKEFVAEGRSAFATVTSDVKQIAAVKSPTELLKVQSEITRKNLDAAIALGSKNSEAVLKLASDVLAPISGRFSLAAEKVRKLAA
jgi:hypothetical protein